MCEKKVLGVDKLVCMRNKKYMVKNTECLNTTNCCAFKGSNVSNDTTTVFHSRRCSIGMIRIINFFKIPEEKKLFIEYFE